MKIVQHAGLAKDTVYRPPSGIDQNTLMRATSELVGENPIAAISINLSHLCEDEQLLFAVLLSTSPMRTHWHTIDLGNATKKFADRFINKLSTGHKFLLKLDTS